MSCWITTDTPASPNGSRLAMTAHGSEGEAWARVDRRHQDWFWRGLDPILTPRGTYITSPKTGLEASMMVSRCSIH